MTTMRLCVLWVVAGLWSVAAEASMPKELPFFQQTVNGVVVDVRLMSDDIIHVRKYPEGQQPVAKSYSVIMQPEDVWPHTHLTDTTVTIGAGHISCSLDLRSGCLSFYGHEGQTLFSETGRPTLEACQHRVDAGKYQIGQSWQIALDEDVYGLGQLRDEAMTWQGRDIEIWNHNTYISIPYVTSSKGYGLYWDNAGRSRLKESGQTLTFSSEVGACVDYYVIYKDGTQDGVIAGIRRLTGQATMFPLWTMGHWQCRERYKTSDELAEVLDKYRQLQIPLDGIVQDWQYWGCDSNWNAMRFENPYYINKVGDAVWDKYLPDDLRPLAAQYKAKGLQPRLKSPQAMVDYVHSKNAHLMISIWASFGPWTQPYRELKAIGALLPFDTWPQKRGVMPYDAFNPQARDIYWQYLSHLYQMGFDAWWTDSTEPDHFEKAGDDDYMTHDGSWRSVKNAFPLMTNRGIYEHQRAANKGNAPESEKRSVQMTRSGSFGIQHYGTFSWSGDIKASWAEMKNQIPSGLNYTLCGIPFWNTDLGGFFYWDYEQSPKNVAVQELQTRWMQWGTFMPLMRNHCSSPMVSEIYAFGEKGYWAYDAMVDAVKLRYRLLPYIYAMAGEVVQHSGSMMRPLVMDFPADVTARRLNDEYMFGHALLVKPVTDPFLTRKEGKRGVMAVAEVKGASAPVSVYLPGGTTKPLVGKGRKAQGVKTRWYDFYTNKIYDGGQRIERRCTINEMPVYVRAGSVMPFGPEVQYSSEKAWDDLEIRVYPGADGQFTLYEDEGDNYNYEKGHFSEIGFYWDDAARTLTIGGRAGSFKGMLKERRFRIVLVNAGKGPGNQPMEGGRVVEYRGKKVDVKF